MVDSVNQPLSHGQKGKFAIDFLAGLKYQWISKKFRAKDYWAWWNSGPIFRDFRWKLPTGGIVRIENKQNPCVYPVWCETNDKKNITH